MSPRSPSLNAGAVVPTGFLSRRAEVVAPELLGWSLTHATADGLVTIVLTEVEAYGGETDPASHAWRGRTSRNAVMFGAAGGLYVYLSHGLHVCANIVTGPEGVASAVLLRAGSVIDGVELARARRGDTVAPRNLARGPGNLGQALGLSVGMSGTDLLSSPGLRLTPPATWPPEIAQGPRVGISRAAELPWRFWIAGDPSVSAYRRGRVRDL